MAETAARDHLDRLMRSHDRLRTFVDRTSVAFYRVEQYAQKLAKATAGPSSRNKVAPAGSTSGSASLMISTRVEIFLEPVETFTNAVVNFTKAVEEFKKAQEKGFIDRIVDVVDKISTFAGLLGVWNDISDFIDKRKNKNNGDSSSAAQRVVCVCECCKGTRAASSSMPQNPGDSSAKKSGQETKQKRSSQGNNSDRNSSRRNGSKRNSIIAGGFALFENLLTERTKPSIPPLDQTPKMNEAAEKTSPSDLSEKATEKAVEKTKPKSYSSGPKSYNPTSIPTPPVNDLPSDLSGKSDDVSGEKNGFKTPGAAGKSAGMSNFLKVFKLASKSNALLNVAAGVATIATAENKTAAAIEVAAGAGGAAIGSALGTALLPGVGTVIGGMVGGWLGEKAGRFISQKWQGKTKPKTGSEMNASAPPSPQLSKKVEQTNIMDLAAATGAKAAIATMGYSGLNLYSPSGPQARTDLPGQPHAAGTATPPDNIYNITVDGVQIVMPKEEIDERALAEKIGWEIVSKMKLAMENKVMS